MGISQSVQLDPSLSALYQKQTVFSAEELNQLYVHFKSIAGESNEKIARSQFQAVLLFKDTAMLDRIFRVFDKDEDGMISFEEYIQCVSVISSKASHEDKLKVSFQIYDFDGDNMISTDDLTSALAATLREHDIIIQREQIDEIVSLTMDEVDPTVPNMISFSEYEVLAAQRPEMLSRLTLNISGIIKEFSRSA